MVKTHLSGHLEQSEVLIDSVAVVVLVHDDPDDVHPRLQDGGRQYYEELPLGDYES